MPGLGGEAHWKWTCVYWSEWNIYLWVKGSDISAGKTFQIYFGTFTASGGVGGGGTHWYHFKGEAWKECTQWLLYRLSPLYPHSRKNCCPQSITLNELIVLEASGDPPPSYLSPGVPAFSWRRLEHAKRNVKLTKGSSHNPHWSKKRFFQ